MNAPESIGFLVGALRRRMELLFGADLARHGISPKQYSVLARLWREDGRTVGHLARALYTDQASVSRLLDRMERQGFLARRADPSDRRLMRVHLSARGAALERTLRPCRLAANERLVGGLTDAEAQTLRDLLERMLAGLGLPDLPPDVEPRGSARSATLAMTRNRGRRNPRRKV